MTCDLPTVLLALKLANGQIPKTVEKNLATLGSYGTGSTAGTGATAIISSAVTDEQSAEEKIKYHEREIKYYREQLAAEKKRKDDKAFIDKTLKECGKLK